LKRRFQMCYDPECDCLCAVYFRGGVQPLDVEPFTIEITHCPLHGAARDLLTACYDLAQWVRRRTPADNWPVEYERAMRAIAKAKGE
jgi:hypothetical protein